MEFPLYNFDSMSETDIREEIVAPLQRYLEYPVRIAPVRTATTAMTAALATPLHPRP